MKSLGLTLITLAFLGGSYVSVLDERVVAWDYFGAALVLGFIGVALVRLAQQGEARSEERVSSNIAIIESSLQRIVEEVTRLNAERESIDTYDLSKEIDRRLIDDLNAFVDARKTIGVVYGLPAYAEVMTNYAGGERYLNRVWSASADGYIDEAHTYLDFAQEQFNIALKTLQALEPKV